MDSRLIAGAYSKRYKGNDENESEHLRKLIHSEFHVDATKGRRFSMETNRRRRLAALKRRQEAQIEEKRRLQILRKRHEQQKEATEKYQRYHLGLRTKTFPLHLYEQRFSHGNIKLEDALALVCDNYGSSKGNHACRALSSRQNGQEYSPISTAFSPKNNVFTNKTAYALNSTVSVRNALALDRAQLLEKSLHNLADSRSMFQRQLEENRQMIAEQQDSMLDFSKNICLSTCEKTAVLNTEDEGLAPSALSESLSLVDSLDVKISQPCTPRHFPVNDHINKATLKSDQSALNEINTAVAVMRCERQKLNLLPTSVNNIEVPYKTSSSKVHTCMSVVLNHQCNSDGNISLLGSCQKRVNISQNHITCTTITNVAHNNYPTSKCKSVSQLYPSVCQVSFDSHAEKEMTVGTALRLPQESSLPTKQSAPPLVYDEELLMIRRFDDHPSLPISGQKNDVGNCSSDRKQNLEIITDKQDSFQEGSDSEPPSSSNQIEILVQSQNAHVYEWYMPSAPIFQNESRSAVVESSHSNAINYSELPSYNGFVNNKVIACSSQLSSCMIGITATPTIIFNTDCGVYCQQPILDTPHGKGCIVRSIGCCLAPGICQHDFVNCRASFSHSEAILNVSSTQVYHTAVGTKSSTLHTYTNNFLTHASITLSLDEFCQPSTINNMRNDSNAIKCITTTAAAFTAVTVPCSMQIGPPLKSQEIMHEDLRSLEHAQPIDAPRNEEFMKDVSITPDITSINNRVNVGSSSNSCRERRLHGILKKSASDLNLFVSKIEQCNFNVHDSIELAKKHMQQIAHDDVTKVAKKGVSFSDQCNDNHTHSHRKKNINHQKGTPKKGAHQQKRNFSSKPSIAMQSLGGEELSRQGTSSFETDIACHSVGLPCKPTTLWSSVYCSVLPNQHSTYSTPWAATQPQYMCCHTAVTSSTLNSTISSCNNDKLPVHHVQFSVYNPGFGHPSSIVHLGSGMLNQSKVSRPSATAHIIMSTGVGSDGCGGRVIVPGHQRGNPLSGAHKYQLDKKITCTMDNLKSRIPVYVSANSARLESTGLPVSVVMFDAPITSCLTNCNVGECCRRAEHSSSSNSIQSSLQINQNPYYSVSKHHVLFNCSQHNRGICQETGACGDHTSTGDEVSKSLPNARNVSDVISNGKVQSVPASCDSKAACTSKLLVSNRIFDWSSITSACPTTQNITNCRAANVAVPRYSYGPPVKLIRTQSRNGYLLRYGRMQRQKALSSYYRGTCYNHPTTPKIDTNGNVVCPTVTDTDISTEELSQSMDGFLAAEKAIQEDSVHLRDNQVEHSLKSVCTPKQIFNSFGLKVGKDGHSVLSLEELRLMESLDKLNQRLKSGVQIQEQDATSELFKHLKYTSAAQSFEYYGDYKTLNKLG